MTLGEKGDNYPYAGSIDVAEGFGNNLVACDLSGVCHDKENLLVKLLSQAI